ncbi:hypothetical protein H696_01676 [Fonticula alba]|uniref:t-SNARE coiled-coil homology domain-containing protein n=1 Tax=Fonticula alba TaxID=691883 RepID=A0A058ZEC8_FONAL|nr:hypothetical protein H696_01676 [Fonticula alba]KCV72278.1 hypothetical protein H696_01676 [Fonticula alba]|eukprot:XP_009493856.1 hypothetical protein H696_01676 [Fonticula alba]
MPSIQVTQYSWDNDLENASTLLSDLSRSALSSPVASPDAYAGGTGSLLESIRSIEESLRLLEQALEMHVAQNLISQKQYHLRKGNLQLVRGQLDDLRQTIRTAAANAPRSRRAFGAGGRSDGSESQPLLASGAEHYSYTDPQTALLQQQDIMSQQDQSIARLEEAARLQKEIAISIRSEVNDQVDMLDGLIESSAKTEQRLVEENRNMRQYSTKAKIGGSMCLVASLIVAVVVLIFVLLCSCNIR